MLLLLENPGGGPKVLEEMAVDTGVDGAEESSWRAPIFSSEHFRSSFFLLLAPVVALPGGNDEAEEDWGSGLVELCLPLFFFFFEDFEGDLLSSVWNKAEISNGTNHIKLKPNLGRSDNGGWSHSNFAFPVNGWPANQIKQRRLWLKFKNKISF